MVGVCCFRGSSWINSNAQSLKNGEVVAFDISEKPYGVPQYNEPICHEFGLF